MNYKEWKPIYKKIEEEFGFSLEREKKAARIFDKILQKKNIVSINEIGELIDSEEVFIFGAGPSLESKIINNRMYLKNKIKIAADGATSALLKNNFYPEIIVTDLDGCIQDQIYANNFGSIVVIHSHSDNIEKLLRYLRYFKGKLLGTTQINTNLLKNIHNFGGFTDGDRAVFLADNFNAKEINLVGFDFNKKIGKYSFTQYKNLNLKIKKLNWCKSLIQLVMKKNNNIKYF
jgi:uncharacterized Rossmann fold enzyme